MKGKLLTLEGCEGSGKSTQTKLLTEWLENNKIDFIFAREPGGTAISEAVRGIILDKSYSEMSAECEALLYASSRAQLLKQVVIPALNGGKMVILDRYIDSSLAYQAFARGLGLDFVTKINAFAVENAMPDLTIFLDVKPEDSFRRKGGADKNDRLELAGLEFHNRVYDGYKQLEKLYPNRIKSVDVSGEIMQTHSAIIKIMRDNRVI